MSEYKFKAGDKCVLKFRRYFPYRHPCGYEDGVIITLKRPYRDASAIGWIAEEFKLDYYFLEDWLEPLVKPKSGFGKFIRKIEDANGR